MSRLSLPLLALLGSGCATVATLRPAEKGTLQVEGALGGPVFQQGGGTVPLTLTSIGVRYGLEERADLQAYLYPTAGLLGILGAGVGTSVWAVQGAGAKPDVTGTVRFIAFTDAQRPLRPYLQLGAVASWRLFERFSPYLGVDVYGPGPHVAVAAGVQGRFGRWTLQLEGKGFAISSELWPVVREWIAPADLSSFGVQLGLGYRFGG